MDLGEKIRAARLAAGLSQRQLCGEEITRNMLSQIEHGTARPSMATLRFLAAGLGKPVSFFLEEEAVLSPNQTVMDAARAAFDAGNISEAVQALEGYRSPDPIYDRERTLLECLLRLALAEQAIAQKKHILARELLEELPAPPYAAEELRRRRLLLLAQLPGADIARICEELPSLDAELLLRAKAAYASGEYDRGIRFLEAMETDSPARLLLLGRLRMGTEDYSAAAKTLHRAETAFPTETARLLEICYRELGDYQKAYLYACKQR